MNQQGQIRLTKVLKHFLYIAALALAVYSIILIERSYYADKIDRGIAPTSDYMVLSVDDVIDGDTIKTNLSKLPPPLNIILIRISGIDTPELRGKCQREKDLAVQAKNEVQRLAAGQKMRVFNYKWDKYGGRIDAEVYVNGVLLGPHLVGMQLAVPYNGTGPKYDWCQQ
jgi:endonuclease YncB( thermonuclease family)